MGGPTFQRLNLDWNAEPNAPDVLVDASGGQVRIEFYLNPFAYRAEADEIGRLTFEQCSAWRLGSTNDEGWRRGQCRYSRSAPAWGEFYELSGPDDRSHEPSDWRRPTPLGAGDRHFLFYLRDETFECFASRWMFERGLSREIAATGDSFDTRQG